jgi:hypothetical protein
MAIVMGVGQFWVFLFGFVKSGPLLVGCRILDLTIGYESDKIYFFFSYKDMHLDIS